MQKLKVLQRPLRVLKDARRCSRPRVAALKQPHFPMGDHSDVTMTKQICPLKNRIEQG